VAISGYWSASTEENMYGKLEDFSNAFFYLLIISVYLVYTVKNRENYYNSCWYFYYYCCYLFQWL